MRLAALAAAASLASCHPADPAASGGGAGAKLEAAAVAAGLVVDPASRSILGAWALDTDRACIVPAGGGDGARIGVLVDHGDGQGCAASGTVRRSGEALAVTFGKCRIDARFDGERIVFPPDLPAACDLLCTGRATLAGLVVERQSEAVSEAATLRTPAGRRLCG